MNTTVLPTHAEGRDYVWVTQISGAEFPLSLGCPVRYDGVDYWAGKEQLTGIDKTSGERSAIVRVSTPEPTKLQAWLNHNRIIVAK